MGGAGEGGQKIMNYVFVMKKGRGRERNNIKIYIHMNKNEILFDVRFNERTDSVSFF
jgi:hypothetical protein